MKRRREIGPKRQKNRPALIKFIIWSLVAAVIGFALTYLSYKLVGLVTDASAAADASQNDENQGSFLTQIPAMILATTIMTVLALVFFGVRAYLMGTKARFTLQSGRKKFKRS